MIYVIMIYFIMQIYTYMHWYIVGRCQGSKLVLLGFVPHLQTAYRLDLCSVVTEIDTIEIGVRIWSENVPPKGHHMAQFDLHDPKERFGFFYQWLRAFNQRRRGKTQSRQRP